LLVSIHRDSRPAISGASFTDRLARPVPRTILPAERA
jgi:hypothetical protein